MPVPLDIPIALLDAVNLIGGRTPVGTAMDSVDLEGLAAELKRRAFFSARVENVRLLQRMRDLIEEQVSGERRRLEDGGEGVYVDRGKFVELMRDFVEKEGLALDRRDPDRGSIRDIGSYARLKLIYDTQTGMAQGYAAATADQAPAVLDQFPANELIRYEDRHKERDWPQRWARAGGKFHGGMGSGTDYPNAPGRMVALKTDPVWAGISRFGEPYPPFDFNSGMGVLSVEREEAEALGLIGAGEVQEPNTHTFKPPIAAATRGLDPDFKKRLEDEFGGEVAA